MGSRAAGMCNHHRHSIRFAVKQAQILTNPLGGNGLVKDDVHWNGAILKQSVCTVANLSFYVGITGTENAES